MHNEQVFTPKHVIHKIFEELEYNVSNMRKKHIIDNSCGDGAFLCEIARRYIQVCVLNTLSKEETVNELETYIHGIEIDKALYNKTIENLDAIAKEYGLENVIWDIKNADAMEVSDYDGKMDYVVGNPPYCNVHDLGDRYDKVVSYSFAQGGMTDLYLVFFEIGINMLNEKGKLGYITPNSWLTSKAGTNFRKYLLKSNTLLGIHQYGHKKVFENATTYTCLTFISAMPKSCDEFIFSTEEKKYNQYLGRVEDDYQLKFLSNCVVDGNIYLTDANTITMLRNIEMVNDEHKGDKTRVYVKNGFATLNDKFFTIDNFVKEHPDYEDNSNVLEVVKASNGERHWFFYPYDREGKPMRITDSENEAIYNIDKKLFEYVYGKCDEHKIDRAQTSWWLFGRTQAIKDVKYDKIIVNNLIRDVEDIKIEVLKNTEDKQYGIYSGFFIPLYDEYKVTTEQIIDFIRSEKFVEYVKVIGKYKNGGYYTFSSKDLDKYINYCVYTS